jgi:hypothetical protein
MKFNRFKMRVYALACVPVVLVVLALGTGEAGAWHVETGATVAVATDCSQTATLTITNPAWQWGSSADAVISGSDHPGVIPNGQHISIQRPYTTTTLLTATTTFNFSVTWVGNHEPAKHYSITATRDGKPCTVPCPPGTHAVGQTHSIPPSLVCEPDTPTTSRPPVTEPPTSLVPPAVTTAPPAAAVPTTPAVTG